MVRMIVTIGTTVTPVWIASEQGKRNPNVQNLMPQTTTPDSKE